MSILISFAALIIAAGAFVGCVRKTMRMQAQIGELAQRITDLEKKARPSLSADFFKKGEDVVMPGAPPGIIALLRYKDGRFYETTVDTPTVKQTGRFPGTVTADELQASLERFAPPMVSLVHAKDQNATTAIIATKELKYRTESDLPAPPKKTGSKKTVSKTPPSPPPPPPPKGNISF
jgi:hypothetical protein